MSEAFSDLSQEERELRLTALILGELSPVEAVEVQRALAADPELAREHARIQRTIELVRETAALDRDVATAGVAPRLDEARREKLLAMFKAPVPRIVRPRRWRKWFVPMTAAAVLIGLLALVAALPIFVKARAGMQRLALIEGIGGEGENIVATSADQSELSVGLTPLATVQKTPAAPNIALPGALEVTRGIRVNRSGQAEPAGSVVIPEVMFNDAGAALAGDLTVAGSTFAFALDQTSPSDASGLLPATAPVAMDRFRDSTITTTSGRQSTVPAPELRYAITQFDADSKSPKPRRPAIGRELYLGQDASTEGLVTANGAAPVPPVELSKAASSAKVDAYVDLNRNRFSRSTDLVAQNEDYIELHNPGSAGVRHDLPGGKPGGGNGIQPLGGVGLRGTDSKSALANVEQEWMGGDSISRVAGQGGSAPSPLQTRVFQVDPNTLASGLQNVTAANFGQSQGGGGGGGGNRGGNRQKQGAVGGGAGGGAQPQAADGISFLSEVTASETVVPGVANFFTAAGVDLTAPGKSVFYDDRLGTLSVRGTAVDLDTAGKAMEVLGMAPPRTTIAAKFMDVQQDDGRALGLNWFGNVSGGAPAGLASGADRNTAVASPDGAKPGGPAVPATPAINGWDLAVNGSDPGLAKLGSVTDGDAGLYINGVVVKGNIVSSDQSEAKGVKVLLGNSSSWKSEVDATGPLSETADRNLVTSGLVNLSDGLIRDEVGGVHFMIEGGEPQLSGVVGGVGGFGGNGVGGRARFGDRLNGGATRGVEVAAGDLAVTSPANVDLFYTWNFNDSARAGATKASGDVNGRVAIQLPALANVEQLDRQSSPTRPVREGSRLGIVAGGYRSYDPAHLLVAPAAEAPKEKLAELTREQAEARVEAQRRVVSEAEVAESATPAPIKRRALSTPSALARTNRVVARQSVKETLNNSVVDAEKRVSDPVAAKPSAPAPTPQPEVLTRENAFSTFSLNVSDVSFKLAAASLEKGAMPEVASLRSEEFLNAFDYRDPIPAAGVPVAFAWERARYPFAHNREALRFSVKTAAQGRESGKPLNIVLLLDNSGSMERADRVRIIQQSLRALAAQLKPQDKLSVVTFARTPRLWADGVTGAQAADIAKQIGALTPEGGTNLEEAMDLAYRTALKHYAATSINRVVLLTDGAANLGNVEPKALKAKVEGFRKQGVALDCFGIGWDGFNDDLLEQLSRNGDGRYGFVNTPEEAATEFVGQLAGALRVAASDVKVQVEFNPKRVTAYRQIGYAKHQLTKQQFRDNTVDAAEIGASEAGNGLYIIETNPRGEGPIATVRARFRIPQTSDYREHEWVVPFGSAVDVEQSSSAMRLATSASAFSEWLASSPFSGEVTTDRLLQMMSGVPEVFGADTRPKKLEWMIRQAKSISGK